MPAASGVHAPVATVAGLTEQTRVVVPNAKALHGTPRYHSPKRFSFNSTLTIGLS